MQSMWAGTLRFGLIEIPVRLGPATRPRELAFRQVHADDGGRITFRRSCSACGADVSYAGVAKAYQRPDGTLVPLTDQDLATLPLEAAHRIEIRSFVAPGTIDPLLVSRSYFLTPADAAPADADADADAAPADAADGAPDDSGTGAGRDRAFGLFHTALTRSGRVAVATITVRQREARAAIWTRGPALVLQTLLSPGELTDPAPAAQPGQAAQPAVASSDLSLATDLITAMTGDFDPAAHHDRYRDQLDDLVARKAPGHPANPANPANPGHPANPANPANPAKHLHYSDPTGHSNQTALTELLRASLATRPMKPG